MLPQKSVVLFVHTDHLFLDVRFTLNVVKSRVKVVNVAETVAAWWEDKRWGELQNSFIPVISIAQGHAYPTPTTGHNLQVKLINEKKSEKPVQVLVRFQYYIVKDRHDNLQPKP